MAFRRADMRGGVSWPHCFAAIPGAGHFLTDQVPEAVNAMLLEHLSANHG
jgi:hypothetical protein